MQCSPLCTRPYSIVKDSSADLGVNFKIVQNRPTVKAVCTKISKFFFAYLSIFLYFWEKIKRYHFSYFEYSSSNSPKLNQNYYWLWVYFGISVSNGQIRITVLNYTVLLMNYLGSNSNAITLNWTEWFYKGKIRYRLEILKDGPFQFLIIRDRVIVQQKDAFRKIPSCLPLFSCS